MDNNIDPEVVKDERPSMMSITGRNAAYALGLALGAAFALSLVYTLMSLILDTLNRQAFHFSVVVGRIFELFKVTAACAGPIVFLISFALLQRFKIKY
jgi:hypothetical protein